MSTCTADGSTGPDLKLCSNKAIYNLDNRSGLLCGTLCTVIS